MDKLRIFYAAGPGDVIGSYFYWKKNQPDPNIPFLSDSGQFYDIVKEFDAEALVISSCKREDKVVDGKFTILNKPKKSANGIWWHLYQIFYGLQVCFKAKKFKPHIAIIEEGTTHWFVMNLLSWLGVTMVPSLKCVLWPALLPLNSKQKVLNYLNSGFFAKRSLAILSISNAVTDQISTLTHEKHPEIIKFLTFYDRNFFSNIPLPDINKKPFQVLFVGRIVENKGVFDLLEIASRFKKQNLTDIHFHFCGTGPDEATLKEKILSEGLSESCHFHGYCLQDQLKERLGQSHIVVVPTQRTFIEGTPNTLVEGVLSGRPVVTSRVCPAIDYVKPAVVEVKPDDVNDYFQAIQKLYADPEFYLSKQKACDEVKQQFFDPEKSWKAAVRSSVRLFMNAR